jgi:tetratricopeptide (TPR) repeat protein
MIRFNRSSLLCALFLFAFAAMASAQQSPWAAHMQSAKQARQAGNYDDAEKHFQAAIDEAERNGPDELRLASGLNSLALLYQAQERYADAERLFERGLALLEKKLGADHLDVATCLANLGMLQLRRKEWLKAEPTLQRALKIREKRLGDDHLDVANSLDDLAALYLALGRGSMRRVSTPRPEPVTPVRRRVNDPQTGVKGTFSAELPTVLPPMPSGASGIDYSEEAQSLLKRVVAIRVKVLGEQHPETLASMDQLANLCLTRRDFGASSKLYARTMAIREQQPGIDVNTLLGNVYALAQSLAAERKYAEAEPYALQGLRLTEQHRATNLAEVAVAVAYLAEIYRHQRKYADAEPLFQRSLAMLEDQPEQRRLAAWVMQQYALLLRSTRRWPEAKEMEARVESTLTGTTEARANK